ncbi:benzoate transport [Rhizobium mesoamericanum]|uniref:MFS transporter n=1 Tax=Rhizobium mesoamericanum TaxID=1079800 RepID=UPI00278A8AF8|nr:MFS transporter [Rhizobium mesoamericanum]MDQ0559106.1 benzoate transport [Rhizobium mesoamericanum]
MTLDETIKNGPMRPAQVWICVMCVLLAMIDGYEVVAVPFSMPTIARAWNLPNSQVGYLLSAGIFGMALGALFVSPLADRIGRRRHVLLCLAAITALMTVSGLCVSLWQLVAVRAAAGLFIGAMISSLNIIVSEYSSDRRRGLVMGLYGAGLPMGSALAGFAIAPMLKSFGWQTPFFFGSLLTGAMLFVVLFYLPESIEYLVHRRPKDALKTYNRIATRMRYAPVDVLPPAKVSSEILATKPGVGELLQPPLLARTAFLWIGYALLISSFYFANTWTAKIISDATGDAYLGVRTAMLIQSGGVLGAVLYGLLTLWINGRLATVLLLALGGMAFTLYAQFSGVVSAAMLLAFAIGICANGGVAAFYAISPTIYPTVLRGTGVGMMIGFGRGVAILAPLLTGYMLSNYWTPVDAYRFFAIVMALAAVATAGLHLTYRNSRISPAKA